MSWKTALVFWITGILMLAPLAAIGAQLQKPPAGRAITVYKTPT